jgi:hypothetical protein
MPRTRTTIVLLALVPLVLVAVALSGCGSSGGDATTTATNTAAGTYGKGSGASSVPSTLTGLRNARYCEIIPVTRDKNTNKAEIYNTIGLNDCPSDQWNGITEDAVDKAYGSQQAKLNGPRYWVLDQLQGGGVTAGGPTYVFNGITMAKRGEVDSKLRDSTVGSSFYTPNTVQRDTVWTYKAGTKVYELTAPDGSIYTMQSYSQIKDKSLTIADLDTLASKLQLPSGWKYTVRTLTQELQLTANGTAHVVNDDLYDSYQRRYAPAS